MEGSFLSGRSLVILVFVALLLFAGIYFYFVFRDSVAMRSESNDIAGAEYDEENLASAVFAGGCFWCMESDFEKLDGVADVVSGYSGGSGENPTYGDYGSKGHIEVIRVSYDSSKISYNELLKHFWVNIDPLDGGGQFCDRGHEYSSAIFYGSEEERKLAEVSREKVGEVLGEGAKTEILKFEKFYDAEDYHQGYAERNPIRYKFYRGGCGRDNRLGALWGDVGLSSLDILGGEVKRSQFVKPSEEELREILTPLQYKVTQEEGTERAFDNEYWDNKEEGIYVDIVSGEVLFSSNDKFDSGTGWPSFTKTLVPENVVEREDNRFFMKRTEVRSKQGDSHLGHIFLDGPLPSRVRYCMNSAALRFVAVEDMEAKGYGEWLGEFG